MYALLCVSSVLPWQLNCGVISGNKLYDSYAEMLRIAMVDVGIHLLLFSSRHGAHRVMEPC